MATIRIVSGSPFLENELSKEFEISNKEADIGIIVLKSSSANDSKIILRDSFQESYDAVLSMLEAGIDRILTVGGFSTIQGERWKSLGQRWEPENGYSINSVEGLSHLIFEVILRSKSKESRIYSAKLEKEPTSQWLAKNIRMILTNEDSNFREHQGIVHIVE